MPQRQVALRLRKSTGLKNESRDLQARTSAFNATVKASSDSERAPTSNDLAMTKQPTSPP